MIRISTYLEFKSILNDVHVFMKEGSGEAFRHDSCIIYAGIAGKPNAAYDMGKSPKESSVSILAEYRDMLENGLFPFYENGALTFVPMNKVTFYGVSFMKLDENAFLKWINASERTEENNC